MQKDGNKKRKPTISDLIVLVEALRKEMRDRFDYIERELSETKSRVSHLERAVAELSNELSEFKFDTAKQIHLIKAEYYDLFNKAFQQNQLIWNTIGGVEAKVSNIETRVSNIETRVSNIETRVGNIETQVEAINSRLCIVESELGLPVIEIGHTEKKNQAGKDVEFTERNDMPENGGSVKEPGAIYSTNTTSNWEQLRNASIESYLSVVPQEYKTRMLEFLKLSTEEQKKRVLESNEWVANKLAAFQAAAKNT